MRTARLLREHRWDELDAEQLAVCYHKARRAAARQTGLAPERFPEHCPFSIDDVLNEDWLPDAAD